MSNRIVWVDYAKGIGILLVVYGHVYRGLVEAGLAVPVEALLWLDAVIHSFHIPLFFFLAGRLFYSGFYRNGGGRLMLNNVDTLVYPYLLWSLLQGSVEVAGVSMVGHPVGWDQVLGLWQPRAQFWFIYTLFFMLALNSLICSLLPRRRLGFLLAAAVLAYCVPADWRGFFLFDYLCNEWVFFALGMWFSQDGRSDALAQPRLLLACSLLFVLVHLLPTGLPALQALAGEWADEWMSERVALDNGLRLLADLLRALASILFVVSLSRLLSARGSLLLARVGAASMMIYLAHMLVIAAIREGLLQGLGVESFWLQLLLGTLLAVLLPLALGRLTERYQWPLLSAPISQWLGDRYQSMSLSRPWSDYRRRVNSSGAGLWGSWFQGARTLVRAIVRSSSGKSD